jgi:hypothetical protein
VGEREGEREREREREKEKEPEKERNHKITIKTNNLNSWKKIIKSTVRKSRNTSHSKKLLMECSLFMKRFEKHKHN